MSSSFLTLSLKNAPQPCTFDWPRSTAFLCPYCSPTLVQHGRCLTSLQLPAGSHFSVPSPAVFIVVAFLRTAGVSDPQCRHKSGSHSLPAKKHGQVRLRQPLTPARHLQPWKRMAQSWLQVQYLSQKLLAFAHGQYSGRHGKPGW